LRDRFGKPTAITRRNTDGSQWLSRHYVYRNDYQTLCKVVEPETGVTVMDFDGAGNQHWSAAGLDPGSFGALDGTKELKGTGAINPRP
jgi:hypothetical protein